MHLCVTNVYFEDIVSYVLYDLLVHISHSLQFFLNCPSLSECADFDFFVLVYFFSSNSHLAKAYHIFPNYLPLEMSSKLDQRVEKIHNSTSHIMLSNYEMVQYIVSNQDCSSNNLKLWGSDIDYIFHRSKAFTQVNHMLLATFPIPLLSLVTIISHSKNSSLFIIRDDIVCWCLLFNIFEQLS